MARVKQTVERTAENWASCQISQTVLLSRKSSNHGCTKRAEGVGVGGPLLMSRIIGRFDGGCALPDSRGVPPS